MAGPVGDDEANAFASRSFMGHALRGLIGFGALALAIMLGASANGWWVLPLAIGLVAIALIAFRGCPLCWLAGWFTTFRNRRR